MAIFLAVLALAQTAIMALTYFGVTPQSLATQPHLWPLAPMAAIMLLTWIPVGYDLVYKRRRSPVSVTPEVLSSSYINGGSYRLLDFVQDGAIRNRTFENVTLCGPAVIAPVPDSLFIIEQDLFDESPDAVFLELARPSGIAGLIPVINGVFRRCHFVHVAIAGGSEAVTHWKRTAGANRRE